MTTTPVSPSDRGRRPSAPVASDATNQVPRTGTPARPGTRPEEPAVRPEGPAAAALLGAGVGAFTRGLLTTLAEISEPFKDWLAITEPVGPLSGKTTYSVVVWLVAWLILHLTISRRARASATVVTVTAVLVGLGLVGTFPLFFEMFAAE